MAAAGCAKSDESDSENLADPVLKSLASAWRDLPGLQDRGAAGRIVIAGNSLTRADLDMNWDVVTEAMKHLGSRPTVYAMRDAVSEFFRKTRAKGKPPVTSTLLAAYMHEDVALLVLCESLSAACVCGI